ncbi:hypothetical protein SAMN05421636_103119 [Pricia antarctica]|uniref:TonB protein C-terminal n=1 Tax=Pricia antarctica TaxID=641691 RepID=A0A1G6ZVM5_9FLAO|nr:hypothetical protein [Pricia antarctica]SDE06622.1 hypothetical protein SAMN05421636_103119 [Pricia antarctica]
MKKILFLAIFVLTFNLSHASDGNIDRHEPKPAKIIASQIYTMLGEFAIPDDIRGSKAEVRIAIDNGNYIRVLSVETENEALAAFIRSSIDFEKLNKGTFEKGIVYRVPIEVKK